MSGEREEGRRRARAQREGREEASSTKRSRQTLNADDIGFDMLEHLAVVSLHLVPAESGTGEEKDASERKEGKAGGEVSLIGSTDLRRIGSTRLDPIDVESVDPHPPETLR